MMKHIAVIQKSRRRFTSVLASLAVIAPLFGGTMLGSRVAPQVPILVWAFGLALILTPVSRWAYSLVLRASAKEIASIVLREGLCPSCGYNLFGLSTESDGCISCPECGAAWFSARVDRAEPFEPVDQGRVSLPFAGRLDFVGVAHADDRGHTVGLVHPRLRAALARAAGAEQRARLIAARQRMARGGKIVRLLVGGFFVVVGIGVLILMWSTGTMGAAGLGGLLAPLMFIGLGVGVIFGNFAYQTSTVVAAMKENGLCPSCGSSLRECAVEDDGCRVCRLCRTAWHL
jgi:ribosomal protein L37AE/L43A